MKDIQHVGTLDFLLKTRQIYKDPLPFHRENFQKYGPTFKITPKPGLTIHFTCDEKLTRHILQKNQKNYDKSSLQTEDLGKYIGHGLLTENGDKWRANRKLIQPAFYKKSLVSIMDTMNRVIKEEIATIPTGKPVDIYHVFNSLAFKVVARSLFYLDDIDEEISRLQHITESAQKSLIKELRIPFMKWYFDREWLAGEKSVPYNLKLVDEGRDILRGFIAQRRADPNNYDDLLDMLLHSTYEDGTHMDDDQLVDEILVLFIAGHETTANALSFALQLIANHPTAQQTIREQALSQNESNGLMPWLGGMEYVKQCIEETLRLYPPAYVTDRVALEDDQCGDYTIPAGSIWLISFYEMHHRSDLWEKPEQFIPERFETERARKYRDFYFPFGAGPRMCVGNNFAMFEMMLAITRVLQSYRIISVNDNIEYHPLITLKPKNAQLIFEAI
jgi:cytochrome P450